jgi:hypothetical protein
LDVANDSGFGYRKTFANSKQVIFSSLAGELQESEFNLFSANSQYSISVEGHGSWSFGHTAESQSSLVGHSQGYDWIFSSQYLAGLLLGISKCISPKTHDIAVRLTTGLPYRDFDRGKDFREQFKHSLLGNYRIERNGIKQSIVITSVLQTPQAYGPIFYHLFNDKGEFIDPATDREIIRIGSLNTGSNTVEIGTVDVDLAAMRDGRIVLSPVKYLTQSKADGVFTTLPILREFVKVYFPGEFFKDFELLEILKTGQILRYEKNIPIDLSPIKSHLYRNIVDNFLTNVYKDETLGQFYSIVNTGGGAHLLDLNEYHPNVWQSNSPTWDTVLGYSKLRKIIDRR